MARQTSALQVQGSIGNLSFYHHRVYGYLVRRKGGPSREKVKHSAQFARTRENASEFGAASSAGKLIRMAIRSGLGMTGDLTTMQRLTSCLVKITQTDALNERGKRIISQGLEHAEGRSLLQNMAFFERAPLDRVLRKRVHYDPTNGLFSIDNFDPTHDLVWPEGATHVQIQGMTGVFDLERGSYRVFVTEKAVIAREEDNLGMHHFACPQVVEGTGLRIGALKVVFYQEQNGELYVLQEGRSLGMFCGEWAFGLSAVNREATINDEPTMNDELTMETVFRTDGEMSDGVFGISGGEKDRDKSRSHRILLNREHIRKRPTEAGRLKKPLWQQAVWSKILNQAMVSFHGLDTGILFPNP